MKFLHAILFSIGIHLFVFLYPLFRGQNSEILQMQIQKGNPVSRITFRFPRSNAPGKGDLQEESASISAEEGTLTEEIIKIKNKITYPEEALEEGLESECEWKVRIGGEGKASEVQTVVPCRYRIFDTEFRRVIKDWNFKFPENTILQIPVSFKLGKNPG